MRLQFSFILCFYNLLQSAGLTFKAAQYFVNVSLLYHQQLLYIHITKKKLQIVAAQVEVSCISLYNTTVPVAKWIEIPQVLMLLQYSTYRMFPPIV